LSQRNPPENAIVARHWFDIPGDQNDNSEWADVFGTRSRLFSRRTADGIVCHQWNLPAFKPWLINCLPVLSQSALLLSFVCRLLVLSGAWGPVSRRWCML
jgi:hypothetical protein